MIRLAPSGPLLTLGNLPRAVLKSVSDLRMYFASIGQIRNQPTTDYKVFHFNLLNHIL